MISLFSGLYYSNTRRFRLTYSQAGARVELTQLAFAASGIEYEENRIEMENGLGMTKSKKPLPPHISLQSEPEYCE